MDLIDALRAIVESLWSVVVPAVRPVVVAPDFTVNTGTSDVVKTWGPVCVGLLSVFAAIVIHVRALNHDRNVRVDDDARGLIVEGRKLIESADDAAAAYVSRVSGVVKVWDGVDVLAVLREQGDASPSANKVAMAERVIASKRAEAAESVGELATQYKTAVDALSAHDALLSLLVRNSSVLITFHAARRSHQLLYFGMEIEANKLTADFLERFEAAKSKTVTNGGMYAKAATAHLQGRRPSTRDRIKLRWKRLDRRNARNDAAA